MGFPNQNPLLLLLLFQVVLIPITSSSHVSLSVSPPILPKSGATLRVQWSGIERPSDLDWLGIYSPPDSRDKNFIGYVFLNTSPSWQSGSGAIELPFVNLRSPYQFRIFRWTRDEVDPRHHDHDNNPLPGTRQRLAVSEEVRFQAMDGPEQLHLSFTDRDDEMRVLFVDGDAGLKYIKYGLTEGGLDQVVGTEVRRYERKHMCDWPANSSSGWRDPGFVHDGVMKNLEMGTRYYYKVGSDLKGWSEAQTFVSRDNDSNETIAFLFGDMGTYAPYATFRRTQEESRLTVKWILRDIIELGDKPSFVSHIGDISYARGYSWLWDEFFNQIEPIAARVPYHVSIGNHEYDWPQQPWRPEWSKYGVYGTDGGGECGVPYSLKFHMPGSSSLATGSSAPDTRNLYYSFDAGVVHFLYMSTETDFLPGSHQYEFIKQDLQSVDREKTPYIVVQGHRPMYTTSNELRDTPLRERMLEHLEPLLIENNVTLALWGHVHRYERFCPLRNFTCLDTSSITHSSGWPVHVVIGMAGQDWQPIWMPRPDHTDVPIFPQPERSMHRGGEFGYTRLVATREKLTLTYVGNHDGQAHDMVEILSGYLPSSNASSSIHVVESKGDKQGMTLTPPTPKQNKSAVAGFLNVYVKYTIALLLGAFAGYAIGFVSCSRRLTDSKVAWTPVKSVEI